MLKLFILEVSYSYLFIGWLIDDKIVCMCIKNWWYFDSSLQVSCDGNIKEEVDEDRRSKRLEYLQIDISDMFFLFVYSISWDQLEFIFGFIWKISCYKITHHIG